MRHLNHCGVHVLEIEWLIFIILQMKLKNVVTTKQEKLLSEKVIHLQGCLCSLSSAITVMELECPSDSSRLPLLLNSFVFGNPEFTSRLLFVKVRCICLISVLYVLFNTVFSPLP